MSAGKLRELEAALNKQLPDGYGEFDDFADVVLDVIDKDIGGREWTISPYHTGQREDPNNWNSPMIIGVEIDLPHIKSKAIYDGFNWSVEEDKEISAKNYEAVVWNDVIGASTASLISGRPDCFDIIEDGLTFAEAVSVAANHTGNCAVRKMGQRDQIVRGSGELNFADNMAKKLGLDGQDLIDRFNGIYYGEMVGEWWDYAE